MGISIVWSGVLMLAVSIFLRSLCNDDTERVNGFVIVVILSAFALGVAFIFLGFMFYIWEPYLECLR